MARSIDYYFDFISPFSYLAQLRLPNLARKYGYGLNYYPIDIPTAKLAAGNYGPSNSKVPAKIKVLMQDIRRWAEHYGVPFNFPGGMNGKRMNIGTLYANKKGQAEAYVAAGNYQLWNLGGVDPDDDQVLRGLAAKLGWVEQEFLDYVNSPQGQQEFTACCVAAHGRGVFGAPIIMLDEQVWWGNDRLMFVENYLQAHPAQ